MFALPFCVHVCYDKQHLCSKYIITVRIYTVNTSVVILFGIFGKFGIFEPIRLPTLRLRYCRNNIHPGHSHQDAAGQPIRVSHFNRLQ